MTISASPQGVVSYLKEGLPQRIRDAIDPVFIDRIRNLSCLCSSRMGINIYSIYINGVCDRSVKVAGATLISNYRLQLDTENNTIGTEVYYYGYGCDIPAAYRPVGAVKRDIGTSIFYDQSSVTNNIFINLGGSIPVDEINRVIALTNIGSIPEHASGIRMCFQEGVIVYAAYHHIGGARVTAD
jgi:hypothetical protein